ncbi:MAG: MYXO-CTERM sorting domain-containing protein [Planctomycetota bacterium]
MDLKAIKTLTAAALLATATAATAGNAPFSMVSGPTSGADVSLSLQQTTDGYDFVVSNSSLMGIVTGVYFEMDWNSVLTAGAQSGPAILSDGTKTASVDGWDGSSASYTTEPVTVRERVGRGFQDVTYYNLDHGIEEGESQTFSFTSGLTLEELEDLLGTDGYGVAIRMQGLTYDELEEGWGVVEQVEAATSPGDETPGTQAPVVSEQVEVTSAPSPTAALAGLAIAGIAGLRRRRRN